MRIQSLVQQIASSGAFKQIDGTTSDMQPLFLCSLSEIPKHRATQLLLNHCLSPIAGLADTHHNVDGSMTTRATAQEHATQ